MCRKYNGKKFNANQRTLLEQIRVVVKSSGNDKLPTGEKKLLWERINQNLLKQSSH